MADTQQVESILSEQGFTDFQWISGGEVVTGRWVRMKCMFGCPTYGKSGSCPPHVPPLDECREFFLEYHRIAVIRFTATVSDPEAGHVWCEQTNRSLVKLEGAVFLAGYPKAFALFVENCRLCGECPGTREECKDKISARPSPEALGVDLFSTVRNSGYTIEVLPDFSKPMTRYAFLLVE